MKSAAVTRRTPNLFALACACPVLISACAGLSQMQDSVSHLDQAAHATATAETSFLASVESADCESQFFTGAYRFSVGQAKDFQLAHYCTPYTVTAAQQALRNQLMSAMTLYADKMLALTAGATNKQFDTNVELIANNLKTAATDGSIKLSKPDLDLAAYVGSAFTAIAEMALDQKKYQGVQAAARAMQTHVDKLVEALQKENYAFARSVVADHQVLEGELREEVALAHGKTEAFEAILRSREILSGATGATTQQLATKDWPQIDMSGPINEALPSLQAANRAIANGAPGGVYAAAHDLYARATAASGVYAAMSK